jgi:hypothetical protein
MITLKGLKKAYNNEYNKIMLISAYFGVEDYEHIEIHKFYLKTGKTIKDIAKLLYRSERRTREICNGTGKLNNRKSRVETARILRGLDDSNT